MNNKVILLLLLVGFTSNIHGSGERTEPVKVLEAEAESSNQISPLQVRNIFEEIYSYESPDFETLIQSLNNENLEGKELILNSEDPAQEIKEDPNKLENKITVITYRSDGTTLKTELLYRRREMTEDEKAKVAKGEEIFNSNSFPMLRINVDIAVGDPETSLVTRIRDGQKVRFRWKIPIEEDKTLSLIRRDIEY